MAEASYLESLDLHKVVNDWLKQFELALSNNKADEVADLFCRSRAMARFASLHLAYPNDGWKRENPAHTSATTPKAQPKSSL